MTIVNYKENIIKYLFCIVILILTLLVVKKIFYVEVKTYDFNEVIPSVIEYNDDITKVYVEYPRFNENDEINKIITDYLYNYIRNFKEQTDEKELDMSYSLYYMNDYVNVTFQIINTLSNEKTKNILLNLKNNKLSYITNLYDEEYLSHEIYDLVYTKYSTECLDKVKSDTINNFTYLISDDRIDIYFNNLNFDDVEEVPFVSIDLKISGAIEIEDTEEYEKYIAFTYDDGPSEYTLDILKVLEENDSSATFFVIGNKMKNNTNIIKSIYNSNSEVGSHSYSHKDLTSLSRNSMFYEMNSVNTVFYEITNDYITLLRPPYGKYNDEMFNAGYRIVTWNVDTKDWLVKDSDKIYNNVIKGVSDGCIVLMHDIYPETLEATKRLLPALKEKGYNVVSVSKLLDIKNYEYNPNKVISEIK